jgi:hypothetical protein
MVPFHDGDDGCNFPSPCVEIVEVLLLVSVTPVWRGIVEGVVVDNEAEVDMTVEVGRVVDVGSSKFVLVVLASWLIWTTCIVLVTTTVSITRSVLGGEVTYIVRNDVFVF